MIFNTYYKAYKALILIREKTGVIFAAKLKRVIYQNVTWDCQGNVYIVFECADQNTAKRPG